MNLEGYTENEGPLEGTGNTSLDHDEVLVDDTATESNKSWRVSSSSRIIKGKFLDALVGPSSQRVDGLVGNVVVGST